MITSFLFQFLIFILFKFVFSSSLESKFIDLMVFKTTRGKNNITSIDEFDGFEFDGFQWDGESFVKEEN